MANEPKTKGVAVIGSFAPKTKGFSMDAVFAPKIKGVAICGTFPLFEDYIAFIARHNRLFSTETSHTFVG